MSNKRVLTGVKPTGDIHIGNYLGAMKPALKLAQESEDSFLFIADYHALNGMRDAEKIRNYTYAVAASWLALGLDPEQTVMYRQSDVPEVFELSSLLMNVTPKGLMNRAHSYKASVDKNRDLGKDGAELDEGINMGLYTYPILMAADILIAKAGVIPVGKDQIQHIEMTRDIAGSFNHLFADVFPMPDYKVQEDVGLIVGLDGRKMSKSYNNFIPLFETSKKRRKFVMKIVTDSKMPEDKKDPEESVICQLYQHFATADELAEMKEAFLKGGMGYGDAKQLLFEAMDRELAEPTEKYNNLMDNKSDIDDILAKGADRVHDIARATLNDARKAVGLNPSR